MAQCIEFSMGEEQEIYTIISPIIVYAPAGLIHAPINIKEVRKPIIFINVADAVEYTKVYGISGPIATGR
jgi:hypothetical protein